MPPSTRRNYPKGQAAAQGKDKAATGKAVPNLRMTSAPGLQDGSNDGVRREPQIRPHSQAKQAGALSQAHEERES